jgi:HisJ family histidinol phosphate phosphatase
VIPDNHNHVVFSGDVDAMLTAAEAAGLDEIAFCEHVFHFTEMLEAEPYFVRWTKEGPPLPHATYLARVREAADRHHRLTVRIGVEMDARPDEPIFEARADAFRAAYGDDWDLVIGSVHVLRGDHSVQDEPIPLSDTEAWDDYFDRLDACAQKGRYDVIAHPARLAFALGDPPAAYDVRFDRLAHAAASAGVALEVNGNDVWRVPQTVARMVVACARHGTPISLGSDAHTPASVGRVIDALPALRRCGIDRVARFARRELELVPLPD